MDRPTHREARLTGAIVATAVALIATFAVLIPASAGADPSADEEYVLELPGARQSANETPTASTSGGDRSTLQRGVSGEGEPPQSELAALVSTLDDSPGSVAAGLVLLAALCALIAAAATRPRTGPGA